MVGRDSEILSVMSPDSTRAFRRGYKVSNRTAISASTGPCLTELRALIRELRLWGAYTVQITVDPRDGLPKLLEINARFGHNLWRRTALGVNEPLIFLQLAQGKPVTGNLSFPDGVMLLDPIADLKYLCRQVGETVQGLALFDRGDARRSDFSEVNPCGVLKTLRVYRHEYLNTKRKIFNPDAGNLFVDPSPCIRSLWYPFSQGISAGLERLRKAVASSASTVRP
jgi:hypothetical protein